MTAKMVDPNAKNKATSKAVAEAPSSSSSTGAALGSGAIILTGAMVLVLLAGAMVVVAGAMVIGAMVLGSTIVHASTKATAELWQCFRQECSSAVSLRGTLQQKRHL
jgi:hypothetical protein